MRWHICATPAELEKGLGEGLNNSCPTIQQKVALPNRSLLEGEINDLPNREAFKLASCSWYSELFSASLSAPLVYVRIDHTDEHRGEMERFWKESISAAGARDREVLGKLYGASVNA